MPEFYIFGYSVSGINEITYSVSPVWSPTNGHQDPCVYKNLLELLVVVGRRPDDGTFSGIVGLRNEKRRPTAEKIHQKKKG